MLEVERMWPKRGSEIKRAITNMETVICQKCGLSIIRGRMSAVIKVCSSQPCGFNQEVS